MNKTIITSIDEIKTWEDAKQLLRYWRDENIRKSKDVIDVWERYVYSSINKFGNEKWLVYEQVYIAALDCYNTDIINDCLTTLKKKFPNSVRVKKLEAMKYEASREYKKAIQIYDKILAEDEMNAYIRKRKISCYKGVNDYKIYIDELNEYVKDFQADHEAWLELCDAYLAEFDYKKAAYCLEELILMNPHNHVYNQRYADIKYTLGDYETARSYYSYALKLNPNNVRALYGLLLSTNNLKSTQKTSKEIDNNELSNWASKQLANKYKAVSNNSEKDIESLNYLLKNVSINK